MPGSSRRLWIVVAAAALLAGWWFWPTPGIRYAPGVLIPTDPAQGQVTSSTPWAHNGYTITPLASFEIQARVLGVARYRWDREAELSPYDLALGWRQMSDQRVLDTLSITQSGRWYRWRWSGTPPPLSHTEISHQSANMHIIPANAEVKRQLGRIVRGDLIAIRGKLVRADAPDGWHWQSSLTRTDTGHGACEIIWAQSLEIMPRQ